jgi:hypothetical protein
LTWSLLFVRRGRSWRRDGWFHVHVGPAIVSLRLDKSRVRGRIALPLTSFRRAPLTAVRGISPFRRGGPESASAGSRHSRGLQALEIGKHAVCEKPVALTVDELAAILDVAVEYDRILAVGFGRRFATRSCELREFVSADQAPPAATHRVSGSREAVDHLTRTSSRRRVIGEGCRFVDSLAYVTGSEIVEIHTASFEDQQRPVQLRDNVSIMLSFADPRPG